LVAESDRAIAAIWNLPTPIAANLEGRIFPAVEMPDRGVE
jgi:hypothetical protein